MIGDTSRQHMSFSSSCSSFVRHQLEDRTHFPHHHIMDAFMGQFSLTSGALLVAILVILVVRFDFRTG